jgi:GT2 family glycosyltransferase
MPPTAPSEVAAVGGAIRPFSKETEVERYKGSWVGQPDVTKTDSRIRYTATPNAAFRTVHIRSVSVFDGTLGFNNTDLGIRLIQAGFKIEFSDSAIVYHRNPSTLGELYKHKLKYGKFSFDLAKKHPHLLGESTSGLRGL